MLLVLRVEVMLVQCSLPYCILQVMQFWLKVCCAKKGRETQRETLERMDLDYLWPTLSNFFILNFQPFNPWLKVRID